MVAILKELGLIDGFTQNISLELPACLKIQIAYYGITYYTLRLGRDLLQYYRSWKIFENNIIIIWKASVYI